MTPETLALGMHRKTSHAHTAKVTIFPAEELEKRLVKVDDSNHADIQKSLLSLANKRYSAPALEMLIRIACGPRDVSNAILVQYVEALAGDTTVTQQLTEKLLNTASVVKSPVM